MSELWTPVSALINWADQQPNRRFLIQPRDGSVYETTWAEACAQAKQLASYLHGCAYPKGSRIAIISRNCAESLITDLAVWMAGHVSVQIYPSLNSDTLSFILEHCQARCLFLGAVESWDSMQSGVPSDLPLICFASAPLEKLAQGYLRWDELLANNPQITTINQPAADDLARLIYTSGSTGKPKGVMVPFAALAAAKDVLRDIADASKEDRLISYLPFAHAFESAFIHNASLSLGCELYFSEGLETFNADLRRANPTIFHSVPRLWVKFQQLVQQKFSATSLQTLLASPDTAAETRRQILEQLGLQDTRVAVSGSAPLAASVIEWYRALGLELIEGYGMTEDFAYSHMSQRGDAKVGYVGKPLLGVESRLSDEGEIQIKSPGRMLGYYLNEQASAEAFTEDGWFCTGDLGEFDDGGSLRISGRLKELFKTSKGKYVAPAPIENRMQHPLIENLCVTGANQPQPCVLLVLNSAAIKEIDRKDGFDRASFEKEIIKLLELTNAQLDPHEHLAFAVLLHEPWTIANNMLTPTLKIKRNIIEGRYADQFDAWYDQRKNIIWEA